MFEEWWRYQEGNRKDEWHKTYIVQDGMACSTQRFKRPLWTVRKPWGEPNGTYHQYGPPEPTVSKTWYDAMSLLRSKLIIDLHGSSGLQVKAMLRFHGIKYHDRWIDDNWHYDVAVPHYGVLVTINNYDGSEIWMRKQQ